MKRKKKGVTRQLIESLARGEADLHALADERGMSYIDMARWIERPRHSEILRLLENLQDRRMSLLLASARADAAESLRKMVIDGTPKETARKACVDLLKLHRDRETLRGTSADGLGEGEPTQDAYSTLNRVLAGLSSESRVHPHHVHASDESDTSDQTATSASRGSTRGEENENTGETRNDPQSSEDNDRGENVSESANADDTAGVA